MAVEIEPGDICVISRDILVEGYVAFSKGEEVTVELIAPNPGHPEYKYVVLSQKLGKRFQLSDADIHYREAHSHRASKTMSSPRFWLIAVVAILVLAASEVAVGLFLHNTGGRTVSDAGRSGALVCLDPGHGGSDNGARDNGVEEKEVNLDIALRAKALLAAKGYRVIMTRESDTTVSLARRCAISNGAGASIFVSIHNNARPPDVQGTTTYYYRGSEMGRHLATMIQEEVVVRIRRPDRGTKGSNLYVLRNAHMPAALLECVFLTSGEEARLIREPGFRQKIAEGVAAGIDDYEKTL